MADHRITDFVDQQAIDRLKELNGEMQGIKDTYVDVCNSLIKGLSIKVSGIGDIEAAVQSLAELQGRASASTAQLTRNMAEQGQVIANTTNTISRQLMEQERVNKAVREEYTGQERVRKLLEEVNGTYENRVKRLISLNQEIEANKAAQKANNDALKKGKVTMDEYSARQLQLVKAEREMKTEKAALNTQLKNEEREMQAVEGSYNHLSQQLELLKKAYKNMTEEEKSSAAGLDMEREIQELDAHLKDCAADMGEFQRNVGNYAIACQNGVVVAEDLNRVIEMQAGTIAGCIEQNKELEKAKANLSMADEGYAETLDRINAKIEENKRQITDVDAVLGKQATSIAEAEAQNKQLAEALKLVDFNSENAAEKIAAINAKIEENKRVVEQATPSMRSMEKAMKDMERQMESQEKASSGLIDQMGSLLGINTKFGSSLASLGNAAKGGSVIEGLGTKVKAFGQTLMGLLSNPWVLAFLGIAGVAAGIKWWYDYNKGLIEATRLTKDFTGKSGDELKRFRSEVIGVADTFGKDFKDVLNATDKIATQLGVSFDESLGAIKEGFLANSDAQGTFLADIEKYAPTLRDAGLSAKELVAVISQTRSGVFGEDGLKAIQVASDRLKRMPKATADALDAIGMSHKEVQRGLEEGTLSMMDVIRQASAKISELPENSKEAGEAVFNVFGRKAAAGGMLLVESLADVSDNLDGEKEKMGELAKIQEEQMNSQIELQKTLAAVFDSTGGFFEGLKSKAMIFVNKGITAVVRGICDIANWFIELYNKSLAVRYVINNIITTFKVLWEVCKVIIGRIVESFKFLGALIEGVLTLNVSKITEGWKKSMEALKSDVTDMVKNIIEAAKEGTDATVNGQLQKLSADLSFAEGTEEGGSQTRRTGTSTETLDPEEKREMERQAREQLKALNELEEAKANAMEEGHEKELELIRVKFAKKLREIKGDGERETALRIALMEEMERELAECERKYQENAMKINFANRLATVKSHSQEEYAIKAQQMEDAYEQEKREAERAGADVSLVEAKYEEQRRRLREEYAGYRISDLQDRCAGEQAVAENAYNRQVVLLKQQLSQELEAAGSNDALREEAQQRHDRRMAILGEQYAQDTIQRSIDMTQQMLANEDLSAEERARLATELAKLEIQLEDAKADAAAAANERILESDKRMLEKRMENIQQLLKTAQDGFNAVTELAGAIFSARMQDIETQKEANEKLAAESEARSEEEQSRIEEMVEKKAITEEEGEARKRAAEAKSAEARKEIERKNEELEKKKQALQYRQAVWQKGNSIAQVGLSTAQAIMSAMAMFPPNIPLAAIAASMGAIQLATAIATPIPKYKSGTERHAGGLAVVGDGGKAELVVANGECYITPDTPTIVDIPQGAKVYPDADKFISEAAAALPLASAAAPRDAVSLSVDFSRLERKIEAGTDILKAIAYQQKGQQRAIAEAVYRSDFEKAKSLL